VIRSPLERLGSAAFNTVNPAFSTIFFLLCVMIPVSLAVLILEQSGILYYIAWVMNPLMRLLDLPGEASLVFLSSVFLNIYSAIAVIKTLDLSGREVAILATMCLIAHNFFVECAVMKKTGSSLFKMVVLRLFCAFLAGWVLHFIIPPAVGTATGGSGVHPHFIGLNWGLLPSVFKNWLLDTGFLVLRIIVIIFSLMFIQKVMDEFGIMKLLARISTPFMGIFGLSANTGYLWIVAYVAGIVYGSAILIEQVKSGAVTRSEADLFNHHVGISHSQVEDTLLFVTIGAPPAWIIFPRIILALIVVWVERARRALVRRSFRVKVIS
jgi:spore maturation protein SpmB